MSVDTSAAEPASCCLPVRITPAQREQSAQIATVAKALSDPARVEILDLLDRADGAVCQCDLQPLFDISQPTLSHHLKKLDGAGLIHVERRGKWAYYSINDNALEVLRSWLS